jgi:insulysin
MTIDIKKSPNDKCEYEYIILDNKMRILLIHDEELRSSSCALSVKVGCLDGTIEGMAHFVEHMLFLGSGKYPNPHLFSEKISRGGGISNAFTVSDHTTYYFSIDTNNFEECLDIFCHFFIDPLMSEKYVKRELHAVNSEHEKNLLNDSWRINQVFYSETKENHKFNHFGTGNNKTLNIPKIHEQVVKFYDDNYSSDIMTVVMSSNLSIEKQKSMAKKMFEEVPLKNKRVTHVYDLPFDVKPKMIHIKPLSDINILQIYWQIDDISFFSKKNNKYDPVQFLYTLLGNDSEGSLSKYLRDNKYINSLAVVENVAVSNIQISIMELILTNDGLDNIDYVMSMIYSQINNIKEHVKKRSKQIEILYEQHQHIKHEKFLYIEKNNSMNYCLDLLEKLQSNDCEPENILTCSNVLDNFDNKVYTVLEKLLEYFSYNNSLTFLVTSRNVSKKKYKMEKWYGTEYCHIEQKVPIISKKFTDLPKKNPYICKNNKIAHEQKSNKLIKIENIFPRIKLQGYYMFDDKYNTPYAFGLIKCFLGKDFNGDPQRVLLMQIFVNCINFIIASKIYDLNMANYVAELYCDGESLYIKVYGGSKCMETVMSTMIEALFSKIDQEIFEDVYENMVKALHNSQMQSPYIILEQKFVSYFNMREYSVDVLLTSVKGIMYEDVLNFMTENVVKKCGILLMLIGNINKNEMKNVFKYVEKLEPSFDGEMVSPKFLRIPDEPVLIKYKSKNIEEKNKAVGVYYLVEHVKPELTKKWNKKSILLNILTMMLSELFFIELRTEEKLGYIVKMKKINMCTNDFVYYGISFIVQSNKNSSLLVKRVEKFVNQHMKHIENVSEDKIETCKASLINKLKTPAANLYNHAMNIYLDYEMAQKYVNINKELIQACEKITKKDVVHFYKKYLYGDTKKMIIVALN